MEFIFVRHGQGTHTLHTPDSLHLSDPPLTAEGTRQAESLREKLLLNENDVILVSPTRRTLQTALIWSTEVQCKKIASPFVSPRMFPQKEESTTLPCDQMLSKKSIATEFPAFSLDETADDQIWETGINTLSESEFRKLAHPLLHHWKVQGYSRIHLVSHDGTITSYRQLLSGEQLTRDDFLKETSWIKIDS